VTDSPLGLLRSPKEIISQVHRFFPDIFRQIEAARWNAAVQVRAGKLAAESDFVWGHLGPVLQAINAGITNAQLLREEALQLKACLPTLAVWRLTQGIYRFDEELYHSLHTGELGDTFPVELLYRLPEWGIYIPLPEITPLYGGHPVVGFFASLWNFPPNLIAGNSGGMQLHLTLHLGSGAGYPVMMWLGGNLKNIAQSEVARIRANGNPEYDPSPEHLAEKTRSNEFVIKLLLYLCSEEPDLGGLVGPPKAKTVRGEERVFAPSTPHLVEVGYRLGAAIRRARELEGTHDNEGRKGLPRLPHVRKAHYHLFWTGVGRTVPRVRWVTATLVNMPELSEQFSTVRPVHPGAKHTNKTKKGR